MAVCLGCGSRKARVRYSRTVSIGENPGKRECWRITDCPPVPDGCGKRRRQTIHDEGETRKGWISPPGGEAKCAPA